MSLDPEDTKNNLITPQDGVADAIATQPLSTKTTHALQPDSDEDVQLLDADTALNTAIYSDAPIKGPDWFVAKVTAAAAFANRLPGTSNWSIGNGPGSLANQNPEEAAEEKAEKDRDWFEAVLDVIQEEQQRQREEWERSTHSFAGMNLTGTEYGELGDALSKDGPLRSWLIERMKRDGKSDDEAKRDTDLIALAMRGMALPENQRTQEQREAIEQVNDSPELSRYAKEAAQERTSTLTRSSGASNTRLTNTDRVTSVDARADAMYSDTEVDAAYPLPEPVTAQPPSEAVAAIKNAAYIDFPTAPPARDHHRASLAATEPLDAAPVRVAAAPQPPASAGLDC